MLQPISIATERQFRRDQAGFTEDVELVHRSEAVVLEQVIQATGARIDAKLRRAFRRLTAEGVETAKAAPPMPSSSSSSDSKESIAEETTAAIPKEVVFPLVLQPISIATETQFQRDQAGVIEDVELVHPSEAAVLEQVIQATGVRVDAKLRRAFRRLTAKGVETAEAAPSTPSSSSSSDSKESIAAETTVAVPEKVDSVLVAKPKVIIIPIPQATNTIKACPTEVNLICIIFTYLSFGPVS